MNSNRYSPEDYSLVGDVTSYDNLRAGIDVIDSLKMSLRKVCAELENYLGDLDSQNLDSIYWSGFESEIEDCWLEVKQARQIVEDFFESKDKVDD